MDKPLLLSLLRQMLLIRRFEERSAEMYTMGKIGGFLHLYIGQEAVGVGAISVLEPHDYIVSHYREHGHALARGMESGRVMAELFGRVTGVSKGKGGSMHLFDAAKGFFGGYAIVGAGMPIATGLALASQYAGDGRVTLNFFGDGAVNQGEFHESLNLAALWRLPVVFLCENNQYAMGTSIERTSAVKEVHKRASAYGIPGTSVDGMDLMAVREATREAVERARSGGGPTLLEAITYRFRGHSMADPTMVYRSRDEEDHWKKRDPIPLFESWLKSAELITDAEIEALNREVANEVAEAIRFADESPEPPLTALLEDVYAGDTNA
jgi:pyruvate dehydrogenase E1 component alpha subunit